MFFRKPKQDGSSREDEFADVIARLRDERVEPTPLELDQIKMRALSRSAQGPARTGASMRRTLVIVVATFSLMVSGTGAVIAGKDDDKSKGKDDDKGKDDKDKNAGKKQYTKCKTQKSAKSTKSKKTNKSKQTNGKPGGSGDSQENCVPKTPKSPKSAKSDGKSGNSNNSH